MRIVLVVAQQIVIALLQRVTAKPSAADYLSSRVAYSSGRAMKRTLHSVFFRMEADKSCHSKRAIDIVDLRHYGGRPSLTGASYSQ